MGRLTAWFLLKDAKRLGADCRLSLFDKDSKTHGDAAAFTAAGMLCPYAELEASEPLVFSLGMHALSLWPDIADAMPHDIGFRQRGSLVVAHSNDISDWHHFRHTLDHKLKPFETEQGASHQQTLEQNALQQREPSLSQHFQRALWLPQEACLHSSETLRALQIALDNAGIEWHENTIADHVSAQTVRCGQSEYHFDTVIDCRGLGAKVDQPSLRGVRGELIALYAPEVTIRH
ncbi:FAD-dependent oxidoreductase, partial [bacterium]|nr:FAD-dependent oxidoreductase [bacterium]